MPEFMLEIGSEEIPAGFIAPALNGLGALFAQEFKGLHLAHGEIRTCGAPRRLVLVAADLSDRQPDREEVVTGPRVKAAYDDQGAPTKALLGFMKGQGVAEADLLRREDPKGELIVARKRIPGRPTAELLPDLILRVLPKIPFRKSMRWGSVDDAFARPIHWFVALFDGRVIPFSFAGVASGNETRGHRFMAPASFAVANFEDYARKLRDAFVLVDPVERREIIAHEIRRLAEQEGGRAIERVDLVEEVADLVEHPFPLTGRFEEEFLKVPKELLVSSMTHHQRYFPLVDDRGNLLSRFIVIANTKVADPAVVADGNARVLRARLSDARFFYEEDRKKPLARFVDGLSKVTFEERLGTMAEKVERVREHIRYLAPFCAPPALESALRAATLCKADLLTSAVFEFPELQGIMGRIYAGLDGEPEAVAAAIEEHYRPRFADDLLPPSDEGALVALADKMDTVAGCFGVGLIPTGTADPYALRRAALGILRILSARSWRVPLDDWTVFAVGALGSKLRREPAEALADLLAFFGGRWRNLWTQTYRADLVDAIAEGGLRAIPEAEGKLKALAEFERQPGFPDLAVAFKRVMNILKERPETVMNPDHFEAPVEHDLWGTYQRIRDEVGVLLRTSNFPGALHAMAGLKEPVDRFFEGVLVMAPDPAVRDNRLALLGHLADLFRLIADFRRIQTEG